MTNITGKSVLKKVSLTICAQLVGLAISFILNLIVPKFIDEYQYAYWQTYILYANYVGILHFGLLDGIVLRYAQFDYNEIDKPCFRSQLYSLVLFNFMCAVLIVALSFAFLDGEYKIIGVFVAVSVLAKNIMLYCTYTLQLTNRIKEYAIISIIQKTIYGILVVFVLLKKWKSFYWVCIAELASEFIALLWSVKYNKEIYFGKSISVKKTLCEIKENISAGIFILISNWSAMLLIGSTKMIVQWRWDELIFGKIAFSYSVTGLFITFISAISIVLFPTIKRLPEKLLPQLYSRIRSILSPILVVVLVLYFPGAYIISLWLPNYKESLVYLGVLLPIIIYRTKVALLTNNYLKAYRKEKTLLAINVGAVIIAIIGGLFIAFTFNNIDALLLYTVFTMMCMSIAAEFCVGKVINMSFTRETIIEAAMSVIFIVCARFLSLTLGGVVYLSLSIAYLVLVRRNLIDNIRRIMR